MPRACTLAFQLAFLLGAGSALEPSKATTGVQDGDSPRQLKTRIIGGAKANAKRYPYFTWLNVDDGDYSYEGCGGSLIANDVVLTAAHCIFTFEPADLVDAWVNATARDNTGYEYFRKGIRSVVHPKYDRRTYANDIGLVFLDKPVSGVPTLKLNQNSAVPNNSTRTAVKAIGLGVWNASGRLNYDFPEYLQEVTVDTVPTAECIKKYGTWFVQQSILCAADDGKKGTCIGDSGGPMIIPGASAKTDVQIAIMSTRSFGELGGGCLNDGSPEIFTRVSSYKNWIRNQLCLYSKTNPSNCRSASPTRKPTRRPARKPTRKPS